jgi:cyclopropane-fatty-acyl-phospholipid synthase
MSTGIGTPSLPPLPAVGRWPEIATVSRAPARALVAAVLVPWLAGRLGMRVETPGGSRASGADPTSPRLVLNRPRAVYHRLGARGPIGLGESYQAGDWDADDLTAVLARASRLLATPAWIQRLFRPRTASGPEAATFVKERARRDVSHHYDLSNEFFALFLDETMTYSAALFDVDAEGLPAGDETLAAAQRRKIDRVLDLAAVGPGTRLLEIGTGWGALALVAAARGASVRSVTLSERQAEYARKAVAAAGFGDQIRVDLCDYRDLHAADTGEYDAIVSVEMIEAVGERHWPGYFRALDSLLASDGRVCLQAITMPHRDFRAIRGNETWLRTYIFPGGLIPSVTALENACRQHSSLAISDVGSFGAHYACTLRRWRSRFLDHEAEVTALGLDETFRRTWLLYLSYCEAGFLTGRIDVHHLVLERRS